MEKQISIIIPTYNMEAYIGKCLDSLLIPEIDEVEVLVVNDGSKDRSSEIAHSYAERYPDSIRVIDKANGNYGSCINAALPLATGRYIKVLDADDTFDPSEFSKLVKTLRSINVEVVITNHLTVSPSGETLRTTQFSENVDVNVIHGAEFARTHIINHYMDMHRLAYNKTVFARLNYRQTEGVSYSDSQWSIIPLAYCKTFRCIDVNVYKYLLGREGQTMDSKQMSRCLGNLFTVLKDSIQFYNGCSEKFARTYVYAMLIEQLDYVYRNSLSCLNETTSKIWAEFDKWLAINAKSLYEKMGELCYSELARGYKVYTDLRRTNFSADFRIPLYVRAQIFVKTKLLK